MPYALTTKSSENWKSNISGDLNKLNTFCLFDTDNEFGFPEVTTTLGFEPVDLLPFNEARRNKTNREKTVHLFLDDYMFEPLWTNPRRYVDMLQFFNGMISPTFSIWSNQPYALNLFNMYRSRWITRFFQELNVPVLVDVRWADEDSYPYCFSGIAKNTHVIVNTGGTRNLENRKLFVKGFEPMLKALEPSKLSVYGEYMPVKFEDYFKEVTYYETFWAKRRGALVKKDA